MLSKPKNRKIAAILAFLGAVIPVGIPINGLHKFYLGQPLWGIVYLLLSISTPIAQVASAIEAVWYLIQDENEFNRNFNLGSSFTELSAVKANEVSAIADALRQLDQLREDGLISEYEFEQKRRQWLDRMV